MSHPANALQKAVYARLKAYAPLTAELGTAKIYDTLPQTTPTPYVVIGDDTNIDWSTKTEPGWECTLNIHAFTEDLPGRKKVKAVLGHIYDALHQQEGALDITGFQIIVLTYEFDTSYLEETAEGQPDKYWHGVIRFRALIQV